MGSPLENRFEDAAEQAARHLLSRFPEAKPIAVSGFPIGWGIQLNLKGGLVSAEVLLPPDFPSVLPKVRVKPVEQFRFVIPHVDDDGSVCIISNAAVTRMSSPAKAIDCAIQRATEILESPEPGEFDREFLSYWKNHAADVWAVTPDDSLPKTAFGICCANQWVLAEDKEVLLAWLKRSGRREYTRQAVKRIDRVDLPEALSPLEFPKTVGELIALLETCAPRRAQSIREHVSWGTGDLLITLRIPLLAGHKDVALRIQGQAAGMASGVSKGFRSGKVPWDLIASRAPKETVAAPVHRIGVQSVHAQHIRTRGGNGVDFSSKRVAVVGCGSLGGYVAHMLARMGVGFLLLVDNERLSWDNAGRHILGGFHAGMGKAEALCQSLQVEAPHIKFDWQPYKGEFLLRKYPSVLKGVDIIVSTTGNWAGDFDLNYWARRTEGAPPIVFGWLEPHSVAGHALLVNQNDGGCLACGCTPWGYFKQSVLPEGSVVNNQGRGCADFYQPYGVVEMMPVASMIAKLIADALLGK